MYNEQIPYAQIIEREFRTAAKLPVESRVSVEFDNEEETITLTVDDDTWVMQIGSDDDCFRFNHEETGSVVWFGYPQDWIDLEENG